MNNVRIPKRLGIGALLSTVFNLTQAATYLEIGDAGRLPANAQSATTGSFDSITGTLAPNTGDGEDLYLIYISGGGNFSATTLSGAGFDTELFLLDITGRGVYLNDDTVDFDDQSILPANHPLTPIAAGFYYLGITQCCSEPLSALGAIFPPTNNANHLMIHGPTGPGGALPIIGYSDDLYYQNGGTYTIFLTGAVLAPIPEPSAWALLCCGIGVIGLAQVVRMQNKRSAA